MNRKIWVGFESVSLELDNISLGIAVCIHCNNEHCFCNYINWWQFSHHIHCKCHFLIGSLSLNPASDWSRGITWPWNWPLIGREVSHDLETGLWLVLSDITWSSIGLLLTSMGDTIWLSWAILPQYKAQSIMFLLCAYQAVEGQGRV